MPLSARKNHCGNRAGPFVTVHEWMVLGYVEQIGSSHGVNIFHGDSDRRSWLRHSNCGLEQAHGLVSQPETAVTPYLVLVNREDVVDPKKVDIAHLLSQLLESPAVFAICIIQSFCKLAARASSRTGDTMRTLPSVDTSSGAVVVDFEQFQHAAVDDQCQGLFRV